MRSRTLPIGVVSPTIAAAASAFIFPEIRNPILDKTGLRGNCPTPLFFILFQSISHIAIVRQMLYLSPTARSGMSFQSSDSGGFSSNIRDFDRHI